MSGLCAYCGQTKSNLLWHLRAHDAQRVASRFWSKVARRGAGGCWEWQGTRDGRGYGKFNLESRRPVLAHRFSYEAVVGPIPEGLSLDHLCRNTGCVNPAHLEPVTHKENCLRGVGVAAINARKTHCLKGHPYSGANLLYTRSGYRVCRECSNAGARRRYLRTRTAA